MNFLGITTFCSTIGSPPALHLIVFFCGSWCNFLLTKCVLSFSSSSLDNGVCSGRLREWLNVKSCLIMSDVAVSTVVFCGVGNFKGVGSAIGTKSTLKCEWQGCDLSGVHMLVFVYLLSVALVFVWLTDLPKLEMCVSAVMLFVSWWSWAIIVSLVFVMRWMSDWSNDVSRIVSVLLGTVLFTSHVHLDINADVSSFCSAPEVCCCRFVLSVCFSYEFKHKLYLCSHTLLYFCGDMSHIHHSLKKCHMGIIYSYLCCRCLALCSKLALCCFFMFWWWNNICCKCISRRCSLSLWKCQIHIWTEYQNYSSNMNGVFTCLFSA